MFHSSSDLCFKRRKIFGSGSSWAVRCGKLDRQARPKAWSPLSPKASGTLSAMASNIRSIEIEAYRTVSPERASYAPYGSPYADAPAIRIV